MRASLWAMLCGSLGLVFLASCRPDAPPAVDCTTVDTDFAAVTAQDPAVDAVRRQVVAACAAFTRLDTATTHVLDAPNANRLVALGQGVDMERVQTSSALMRQEIDLLRAVQTALTASNTQLTAALPPDDAVRQAGQQLQPALIQLGSIHAALNTASDSLLNMLVGHADEDTLRGLGEQMRAEIARQETILSTLRQSDIDTLSVLSDSARVAALGRLMRLEFVLLDSAHTALSASNTQFFEAFETASEDSVLKALHWEIERLSDILAAQQQSNQQFLEDLGVGGIGPLGEQASRERSREFGWQVRQGIALMGDVQAALNASNAQFIDAFAEEQAADSVRRIGYEIHQEVARLGDVFLAMERSSAKLAKVQINAFGEELPVDSLKQIGTQIDGELDRQRRVLDALVDRHAPRLGVIGTQVSGERLQEAVRQMEREIGLLDDVHTSLRASNDAFRGALVGDLQQYGGKLILALLVIVVSFFLIRGLGWFLETLAERSAARRLFFKKLIPIVRLTIWGLTIYIVLADIFKLDQRGLLAAATALGVAIGFAAQDILKNIFGGILIIFDQPFQVGDKINVGGTYGEVVSIGLRSTRIVTPDDNLVSVPNSQVVDSQVANANAGALDCQVVVDLFLPGWVDVIKAKGIAYSAAANSKYVYLEKPIVVNIKDEFKETFLTQLKVKAYVLDTRYEFAFASDVTETAKAEFLKQGLLWTMGTVIPPLDQPGDGASGAPSPLESP